MQVSETNTAHLDAHALIARVNRERHGFLSKWDVAQLAASPVARLWPLLVRCGGCRFTAPAQDVAHLIEIITRDGQDYVRDVALVAGVRYE
jgi:hypothetical protein